MFYSSGIIQRPKNDQKEGWYSLSLDQQISDLYKWYYSRGLKTWNAPLNECHMTFIAGEKDDRIVSHDEMERFFDNEIVFYYTNVVYTNGKAFWLPAICTQLDQIRLELCLKPRILYHVTLGNIKN